jgi:hypothetical protein
MINVDVPIKVNNMETLLGFLDDEQEGTCDNSFFDMNEPAIVDDLTYRLLQSRKYPYAVSNVNDSF